MLLSARLHGRCRMLLSTFNKPVLPLHEQIWNTKRPEDLHQLILDTPQVNFTPTSVATGFHRLGKFREPYPNPRVVSKLYQLAEGKEFQSKDLANLMYGVAIGGFDTVLPNFALQQLAKNGIKDFNSTDVTHLLVALARMQHPDLTFFQEAEQLFFRPTTRRLGRFLEKELASCVWSYARMRYSTQTVFDTIAREVKVRNPKAYNARDVAQLYWAFANCGTKPSMFDYEEVYEMLAREIYNNRELKEWCNEEELSLICAGACRKQFANKHLLFRYLAQHICKFRNLAKKEFTTQILQRVLDSYDAIESRIRNPAIEELTLKITTELDRRSADAVARARKRKFQIEGPTTAGGGALPGGKYALIREKKRRNVMLE